MKEKIYKQFTVINTVFVFAAFLIVPLVARYLDTKGFTESQLSLIFLAFPLAAILLLPYFGKLSDLLNKRVVIWAGIWFEVIALGLYIFGDHWLSFTLARFLESFAVLLVQSILLARLEDGVDSQKRGAQTGWFLAVSHIGKLIAPLVGGFLAEYYFAEVPFIVAAVILMILSFFLIKKSDGQKKRKHKKGDFSFVWWSELKLFLDHKRLRGMAILGMAVHAAFGPFLPLFLPLIIIKEFGLSYQAIGTAVFVWGLPHLLQGFFGKFSDKIDSWRGVLLGASAMGLLFVVLPLSPSYYILLIILFLIGVASSMWNVSAWSLMSDIGEKEKIEGQIVTSYVAIAKIGSFFSFLISAWLVGVWGLNILFVVYGSVVLVAGALAFGFLKPKKV